MSNSDQIAQSDDLVRPIIREDLPAVATLIAALAHHHDDRPGIDLAHLEDDLFGSTPWIHAIVAQQSGAIVGYAIMIPRYRAQFTQRGWDMHHLFVQSHLRGQGVGRRLVDAVIDHARQTRCSFLVVATAAGNLQAQAFYRGLGFEPRGETGQIFEMRL